MFDASKFRTALVDLRTRKIAERDRIRAATMGPRWHNYTAQPGPFDREIALVDELVAAVDAACSDEFPPSTECDECSKSIPDDTLSNVNTHHDEMCSLHGNHS